ncbi:MAG: lipopolysaccharide biosynthesis protein [Bacteroidales bacterium]|nr:lipopolysaccharide biosynthesis protein [Bacteroidales bacterium]
MGESELKTRTVKGLFWSGVNNGTRQIVSLLIGLVLLRYLTPDDYGLVGMLAIFSGIISILQEGGFNAALTNRSKVDANDYNSVFWFSSILSLFFYFCIFFCAPLIARFFGEPELVKVTRVLFLSFLISGLSVASNALLFKKMMVRECAVADISSSLVAGVVGVFMAIRGYGYWALVVNTLLCSLVANTIRVFLAPWRPSLKIDFTPVKEMLGFSVMLILSSLINSIKGNFFSLILGRHYTTQEVGYYYQGDKWSKMIRTFTTGMASAVCQPIFSTVNDSPDRQLAIFRKMNRFIAIVACPSLMGLAYIARDFISLLNPEFLPAVPILQICSAMGIANALSLSLTQVLVSKGKSKDYLLLTFIGAVLEIVAALATYRFGIYKMAAAIAIVAFLEYFMWYAACSRHLRITLTDLIKDIVPYFTATTIAIGISYLMTMAVTNTLLLLILKMAITGALYYVILRICKSSILGEAIELIKKRLGV